MDLRQTPQEAGQRLPAFHHLQEDVIPDKPGLDKYCSWNHKQRHIKIYSKNREFNLRTTVRCKTGVLSSYPLQGCQLSHSWKEDDRRQSTSSLSSPPQPWDCLRGHSAGFLQTLSTQNSQTFHQLFKGAQDSSVDRVSDWKARNNTGLGLSPWYSKVFFSPRVKSENFNHPSQGNST